MARAAFRQIVLCLTATGWLSGCVGGTDTAPAASTGAGTPGQIPGPARSGSGREVEAPDVFQANDTALWDGRPSLGGIWVASPEAVDPERVVMFNPATGKSVTGALFRRERENPGPVLQVSSDAADALGMLAGQPTELRVTALRKVEKEAPPADEPAPAPVVAETAAADGSDTEAAALAAAAIAATSTAAAAEAGTEVAVAGAEGAGVIAADGVEAASEAVPAKRKTWKERRAEAKAKRDAEKAAAAAALAGGAAAPTTVDGAAPTAESAGVSAVETAPLDARSPEVAEAAAAATEAPPPKPVKKTRKEIRAEEKAAEQAAAQAEAEAAAAPVAETAAAAPAGRPIQIASFSKEENANRAVEALAKIGVTATPQKSEQAGKIVWGVVATGDDALLQSIKGAGFADAYFLK